MGLMGSAKNFPGALEIVWKKVSGNGNPCQTDLVPGALHFVAKAVGLFHKVGDARHGQHLIGEEGANFQLFTIRHCILRPWSSYGVEN